jgi:hypothetical protein
MIMDEPRVAPNQNAVVERVPGTYYYFTGNGWDRVEVTDAGTNAPSKSDWQSSLRDAAKEAAAAGLKGAVVSTSPDAIKSGCGQIDIPDIPGSAQPSATSGPDAQTDTTDSPGGAQTADDPDAGQSTPTNTGGPTDNGGDGGSAADGGAARVDDERPGKQD